MARIARHTWVRGLWCAYPAVVTFVVDRDAPTTGGSTRFLGAATAALVAAALPPPDPGGLTACRAAAWPRLLPSGRRVSAGVLLRARATAADRVAADAERDLAHGLRAVRRRRRARLAGPPVLGRARVRRRLGLRHAGRPLLAHVGQGHAVRRLPGLHAGPHRGGRRARRGRRALLPGGRRPGGGGGRDRRARLADGLLHARPRRGARRRVQGRHRRPRRPRGDPLRRPAADELRPRRARIGVYVLAGAVGDHGGPAHLARALRARPRRRQL